MLQSRPHEMGLAIGAAIGTVLAALDASPAERNNSLGGLDPVSTAAIAIFDKVDLVTLPQNVQGTNCGNCRFIRAGFCTNPKIKMPVNDRMCCALWDNPGARRSWK